MPKRFHIQTMEAGYADPTSIFLHACFQCLVNFVENEDGLNINYGEKFTEDELNYEFNYSYAERMIPIKRELQELYDYWKARPLNKDEQDDEDQAMLERLVKIRRFLWT